MYRSLPEKFNLIFMLNNKGNVSYFETTAKAEQMAENLHRDLPDFAAYGVTADKIAGFETGIKTVENLFNDTNWQAQYQLAVQRRNALRDNLLAGLKKVGTTLNYYFSGSLEHEAQFQLTALCLLTDRQLSDRAANFVNSLLANAPKLLEAGITNDVITQVSDLQTAYAAAIAEVASTKLQRKLATQDRNQKLLDLYNSMMLFSEIGKTHWKNVNDVKYAEYVIYRAPSPKAPPPVTPAAPPANAATPTETVAA